MCVCVCISALAWYYLLSVMCRSSWAAFILYSFVRLCIITVSGFGVRSEFVAGADLLPQASVPQPLSHHGCCALKLSIPLCPSACSEDFTALPDHAASWSTFFSCRPMTNELRYVEKVNFSFYFSLWYSVRGLIISQCLSISSSHFRSESVWIWIHRL